MKVNTRLLLTFSCVLVLFLSACKKDTTAILTINVLDPNNNPATGIRFDILESIDKFSYGSNKRISSTTGGIRLTLTKGKSYLIYLIASENYSDWYMGNAEATLIADGTFESMEEIIYGVVQKPTPQIGDTRYADFNGDGAINIDDLVLKVDLKDDAQITVNLINGRDAFYER